MSARGYVGWLLPEPERARLLLRFPPAYPDLVAHHVTLAFGVGAGFALPAERDGRIVGVADDGDGLQALVVEIAGTTRRPDGTTYHITWSLDRRRGRRPAQANAVLVRCGWRVVGAVRVRLEPRFFRFDRPRRGGA